MDNTINEIVCHKCNRPFFNTGQSTDASICSCQHKIFSENWYYFPKEGVWKNVIMTEKKLFIRGELVGVNNVGEGL